VDNHLWITSGLPPRGPVWPYDEPMPRRTKTVHSGQFVVTELAVLALVLAALDRSPVGWLVGIPVAVVLLGLAFLRWRRRWLHSWLGIALRFAVRRRTRGTRDLLARLAPGARVTTVDGYGAVESEYGIVAVLELDDPAQVIADAPVALPSPIPLVPPDAADSPAVEVQLLVSGSPAPAPRVGTGVAATSYRQLTDGEGVSAWRAYLAVRVIRDGTWPDDELHRALTGSVRRIRRRLAQDRIPHRVLGAEAVEATVAELVRHRADTRIREGWGGVHVGRLAHTCLRVQGTPPDIGRLLRLPAVATTVSVTASTGGVETVVRLTGPTPAAARQLLAIPGLAPTRLDGQQLAGLAATLPLGPTAAGTPKPNPARGTARPDAAVELPPAGLVVGRNRRGEPVVLRLVRPEPTRVLLVGGIRVAQLLALRALALGIQVVVQTWQPDAWEPFARAVSLPGDPILLVPPEVPPADAYTPQLVVLDGGPVPPEMPWRTVLALRDGLSDADVDLVSRADLAILQPLSPAEAALAGTALGLGEGQEWLARIGADMVGLVNRRAVRFARLAATPWELQLAGSPERATTA
jgi:type VII secretion protein EccE